MQGVTQRTYDAWRKGRGLAPRPVRGIERSEVEAIYRAEYWTLARCGDLPPFARLAHFDAAVNCGVTTAAKLLQRAVRVADDGVIGPKTLAAVAAAGPGLLDAMLWERVRYYRSISIAKRSDGRDLKVFLPGWLGRVLDVRAAA